MARRPSEHRRRKDAMKRGRKLYLRLHVESVPAGVTRGQILDTLQQTIATGDYWLPSGWEVRLAWKNGDKQPWRSDPFSVALSESSESSRGFDRAVFQYLETQRYKRRAE